MNIGGDKPGYRRRLALSRAAILWERLWPGLMPLIMLVAIAMAAAFFELDLLVPGWIHGLSLLIILLFFLVLLWRCVSQLRWPSIAEATRRLERASGLVHRPLQALGDVPANKTLDLEQENLWAEHQRRMRASLVGIRIGWPIPGMAARDPFALRFFVGLILVVGFARVLGDAPARLNQALTLDFERVAGRITTIDAYITPPAYTGLPPIFLTRADGPIQSTEVFRVPMGSILLARVGGIRGQINLTNGADSAAFEAVDPLNYQITREIRDGRKIEITQGKQSLVSWPITIVADEIPEITFTEQPSPQSQTALKIPFKASDDYGLSRVFLRLKREGTDDVTELPLSLPSLSPKEVAASNNIDFTSHLWAGLNVMASLVAEDAAGQKGVSEEIKLVLPAREFRHPVARALIEQRRNLSFDPAKRALTPKALMAIARLPEAYGRDIVIRLGLAVAQRRLLEDRSQSAISSTQELLWDLAVRLEDAGLSLAERNFRDAERALREALARNAPETEIDRLMRELQNALDKALEQAIEQALREGRVEDEDETSEPFTKRDEFSIEDLKRMMERAREMSRQGANEAAQDMLSQLQNMLNSLKNARIVRRKGPSNNQRGMAELGDMLQEQQQLLDRSFRRSQQGPGQQPGQSGQRGSRGQQGQSGADGSEDMQGLANRQEALRRKLGDLMRRLGQGGFDAPQAFGRAEQSMRDAGEALGRSQPGAAVNPQADALDQLRQGAQSLMQQMTGQNQGEGDGRGNQANRPGPFPDRKEDPLGRPLAGDWDNGDSTKVPTKADIQRAREILEELYRRSGDQRRPTLELEYLERLLKRF